MIKDARISNDVLYLSPSGRADLIVNLAGCFTVRVYLYTQEPDAKIMISKRNAYRWIDVRADSLWGSWKTLIVDTMRHSPAQNPIHFDFWGSEELLIQYVEFERILNCDSFYGRTDTVYSYDQVRVIWDMNDENDIENYRIYWDTLGPRNYRKWTDVGLDTNVVLTGLKDWIWYYLTVTALDSGRLESDFSFEDKFILLGSELEGDKNKDGKVDFIDAYLMAQAIFTTKGNLKFDSFFDFNRDDEIDFLDRYYFVNNCYGKE